MTAARTELENSPQDAWPKRPYRWPESHDGYEDQLPWEAAPYCLYFLRTSREDFEFWADKGLAGDSYDWPSNAFVRWFWRAALSQNVLSPDQMSAQQFERCRDAAREMIDGAETRTVFEELIEWPIF